MAGGRRSLRILGQHSERTTQRTAPKAARADGRPAVRLYFSLFLPRVRSFGAHLSSRHPPSFLVVGFPLRRAVVRFRRTHPFFLSLRRAVARFRRTSAHSARRRAVGAPPALRRTATKTATEPESLPAHVAAAPRRAPSAKPAPISTAVDGRHATTHANVSVATAAPAAHASKSVVEGPPRP